MARTDLTPVTPVDGGSNPTPTVGTVDGHMFKLTGQEVLVVANSHATLARNFIIKFPRTVEGQTVPDRTVSIPAVSRRYFSDLEPSIYTVQTGVDKGKMYVNYDVTTPADLNIVVLKVLPAG